MVKSISSAVLFCVCSTAAVGSLAQSDGENGWRLQPEFSIGGGYGVTALKDEDFDEDEAAKKAFALVKLNEYIGLETAYIDFDEARNGQAEFDAEGVTLGLILEAPITQMFSVYAKGGQMWWDADATLDLEVTEASNSFDGDETFWGVGTKFQLTEHLDLKLEYERFNFEVSRDEIDVLQSRDVNMDVDYASANLQFTF
ncbi:outer membrane beta-barrel protein [Gilvimarinus agarilyticus]|uniref:outer membrane beta-barrel protein n=1 Tax=Gilvimarinus agarilyticus TaxID=679259 RepID=UPI00059FE1E6|nr:outer membrane beta-barrel protein [Gilvimarinus agarilyticus]